MVCRALVGVIAIVVGVDQARAQAPAPVAPAESPAMPAPDLAPASSGPPAPAAPDAPAPSPGAPPSQTLPYAPGASPAIGAPPRVRSVMDRRWAIGVDFGPESYRADVDGADPVEFGQFELAVRYRVRAPIELGLALHLGGSNQIGAGGLYFDFRYRFMAEQKLNLYALASIGALAVAHEDGSDDEKRGRGSLRLGGGLEYRWSWFALIFELRLVGVGENKELAAMPTESVGYQLARSALSGGSIALGANFYF